MMQSTANLCKMEVIISLYNFNVQNNATSGLAARLAKTESLYHPKAALYAYITMRETERAGISCYALGLAMCKMCKNLLTRRELKKQDAPFKATLPMLFSILLFSAYAFPYASISLRSSSAFFGIMLPVKHSGASVLVPLKLFCCFLNCFVASLTAPVPLKHSGAS